VVVDERSDCDKTVGDDSKAAGDKRLDGEKCSSSHS
jgi:hypothetical protein